MTDTAVEEPVGASTNGDATDPLALEAKATVLARDDTLAGKLQVNGAGQVLGKFNGEIDCEGDLLIGPEAHVEANIRAARVTVAGYLRGNVVAVNRLKITSTGKLEGEARVGTLVVQEGGVHRGVIRVHPEGLPDAPSEPQSDTVPRPAVVPLRTVPNPVGRVRKFWGEFF